MIIKIKREDKLLELSLRTGTRSAEKPSQKKTDAKENDSKEQAKPEAIIKTEPTGPSNPAPKLLTSEQIEKIKAE